MAQGNAKNTSDTDQSKGRLKIGIDAGGTAWKLTVASSPTGVRIHQTLPFAHPDKLIPKLLGWIDKACNDFPSLNGLGISSFGPIDRDPSSPTYGRILQTRKAGWEGTNLRSALSHPKINKVVVDTDVNGALLAEMKWGAASELTDVVYITLGTGIGGACLSGGHLIATPFHSEIGHISVGRDPADSFGGVCEFHEDCIAGLASGSALATRTGIQPSLLPLDHDAWDLTAKYVARLATSLTYILCPQRIIIGGGMVQNRSLLPAVRAHFEVETNGHALRPEAKNTSNYIVEPALGQLAGALGAVALAQRLDLVPNS